MRSLLLLLQPVSLPSLLLLLLLLLLTPLMLLMPAKSTALYKRPCAASLSLSASPSPSAVISSGLPCACLSPLALSFAPLASAHPLLLPPLATPNRAHRPLARLTSALTSYSNESTAVDRPVTRFFRVAFVLILLPLVFAFDFEAIGHR